MFFDVIFVVCFIFICLFSRITGYSTMKIGKSAAFLIGGSIIVLQVANEQGWIKVDWNKVTRGIDHVGDRVEEAVTGEGPKWMDKVSMNMEKAFRFVVLVLLSILIYGFIAVPLN